MNNIISPTISCQDKLFFLQKLCVMPRYPKGRYFIPNSYISYIYSISKYFYILRFQSLVQQINSAYLYLYYLKKSNEKFLIVNLFPDLNDLIYSYTLKYDTYCVLNYWIRGLVTNWKLIKQYVNFYHWLLSLYKIFIYKQNIKSGKTNKLLNHHTDNTVFVKYFLLKYSKILTKYSHIYINSKLQVLPNTFILFHPYRYATAAKEILSGEKFLISFLTLDYLPFMERIPFKIFINFDENLLLREIFKLIMGGYKLNSGTI